MLTKQEKAKLLGLIAEAQRADLKAAQDIAHVTRARPSSIAMGERSAQAAIAAWQAVDTYIKEKL